MNKFLLAKDLYTKAFEKLRNFEIYVLKAFLWFCVAAIATGIFAFVYRIATGFFLID